VLVQLAGTVPKNVKILARNRFGRTEETIEEEQEPEDHKRKVIFNIIAKMLMSDEI